MPLLTKGIEFQSHKGENSIKGLLVSCSRPIVRRETVVSGQDAPAGADYQHHSPETEFIWPPVRTAPDNHHRDIEFLPPQPDLNYGLA